MDTRQLAAFCEVVERRSFSEAAARLGVTQPAVSASRCGRSSSGSGRSCSTGPAAGSSRPRPGCGSTAAPSGCSRSRSSCSRSSPSPTRRSAGRSRSARRPARRRSCCRSCSASSSAQNTELRVELSVSDTQSVVELVADRRLELGIVGAARRHRSVAFEPFFRDEVILACPPGHPFAGRTVGLDELAQGPLILMQQRRRRPADGRGRAAQERAAAARPRGAARARAPGVGSQRRAGGLRRRASSRGGRSRPSSRPARWPRRAFAGSTWRATSGSPAPRAARRLERRAGVRRVRAGAARDVIVRWGLEELPGVLEDVGIERPLLVAGPRWDALAIPAAARWSEIPSDRICRPARRWTESSPSAAAARSTPRRPRRRRPPCRSSPSRPPTRAPSGQAFFGVRTPDRRQVGGGAGARLAGIVYDPELTLDLPRAESGGTAHERARALRRGALPGRARSGAPRRGRDRPAGCRACSRTGSDLEARTACSRRRATRARRWPSAGSTSATRWRRRSAAATACRTAR